MDVLVTGRHCQIPDDFRARVEEKLTSIEKLKDRVIRVEVQVSAYGSTMPINQVATVSVHEARMLAVNVWDKSMVGAVDRAIREANLGFNPIVDGITLRIPLPELNEQRRKELVKIAHTYAENARVAARHVRRDGMDFLKKQEKDAVIGEDEHRKHSTKVQELTDKSIKDIDGILVGSSCSVTENWPPASPPCCSSPSSSSSGAIRPRWCG